MIYHFANCQPMHHTAAIIRNIVNSRTLSRIEGDTETPLLPFNQRLIGNSKGGSLRLDHVQWFEILASTLGQQLWDVFRGLAVANDIALESLFQQTITLAAGGRSIYPDDLLGMGIHHGNNGQRVRVKVGVFISRSLILSKAKGLEKASVLIGMI
jgi:hypothetical protein